MKNIFKLKLILFGIFVIFFVGFINKKNLKITYYKFRDLIILKEMIFINKKTYNDQLKKYDCLPQLIEEIPKDSTLIIGHAYGRANYRRFSDYISPYVDNFITKNKNKIETIFFTGDLFSVPTSKKWQEFYKRYEKDIELFIVPGNHDVGNDNDNSHRNIFNIEVGKIQSIDFPFIVHRSGFNIVLDDSTADNSLLENNNEFLNNIDKANKKLLILRHHILIQELKDNSGHTPRYYRKKFINNKFKSFEKVIFISGNGGHKKNYDRISCFKYDNYLHILNGIGEVKNDNILILNNNNIYRYEINKF